MERGKKTDFILKQFKRKSKRLINKDLFTEFFYLNKNRNVIEFLYSEEELILEKFFMEFLPNDLKDFVSVRITNSDDDLIKTWYYNDENIILNIDINWGFKKQNYSIEIEIEQFIISSLEESGILIKNIDYILLNDFLISFLTLRARNISEIYDRITKKN